MSEHDCHCGRPMSAADVNLCTTCAEAMRTHLRHIAERWPDLEAALTRSDPTGEKGRSKNSMIAAGTSLNKTAVAARRAATDIVWFAVQVLREDFDTAGRDFTPPPTKRTQDDTPTLAAWLAAWHVAHFTHHTARETAEEIARDVAAAEQATFDALKEPTRRIPVGLPCEQHATSDLGERIPCGGTMRATLADHMPDLVCSLDPSHRIAPDVWSRQYWKRAHVVSESGARALAERMSHG